MIDSITARFALLARQPYIGRRRDEDLRPGVRSFVVGDYVIAYRVDGDNVLILRVCAPAATSRRCSAISERYTAPIAPAVGRRSRRLSAGVQAHILPTM